MRLKAILLWAIGFLAVIFLIRFFIHNSNSGMKQPGERIINGKLKEEAPSSASPHLIDTVVPRQFQGDSLQQAM